MAKYSIAHQFVKLAPKDVNKKKFFRVEARSNEEAYNKVKSYVESDPQFQEMVSPFSDSTVTVGPQNNYDIYLD